MRMCNLKKYRHLLLAFLFASWAENATAFIPVVDPGTIAQGILNNVKLVIEAGFVKNTMNLAGTMNSTIGTSVSTFSDYVGEAKYNKGYSGKSGPGTDNGFFIFSNEIADYCSIETKDTDSLDKKENMVKCLKKLITLRNSPIMSEQRNARDIYVKAFHEAAYANVAEALVHRNFAVNYEKEVMEPLARKAQKAKTVRDDYSGVIAVNKEMASQLNRLSLIYSSKVSYDALKDYGDFEIYPEDLLAIH